jgi:hypothetical protein
MAKTRASSALSDVATRLHQFERDPMRAALLARGIDALIKIAERLDQDELGRAVAAPSNETTLITALTQPSLIGLFASADPLAPARLRGVQARDALLAAEGGTLRAEEVSARLHISRQAVDKRRAAGKVLALEIGRRGYLYPAWQFADDGVLPGLEEVLALLVEHPPLAKLRFFLSSDLRLDGERPLDRLRRSEIESVKRSARVFAEQGAA